MNCYFMVSTLSIQSLKFSKNIYNFISKIYKEFIQLNTRKTNNPIKNGQRTYTDTSARRTYREPIDI